MKKFQKYEIAAFIFFVNSCTWLFLDSVFSSQKYFWFMVLNITLTIIALITFTILAFLNLNISKLKKALLVFAQLIAYFIIYVIWFFIYVFFIDGGINFYY